MKSKISRILSDVPGYFFRTRRKFKIKLSLFYGTSITKIGCRLKAIKLGTNCKFYGRPKIHRNPHCKIEIGNNCSFRSDLTNNIGFNKKSILFARGEKSHIEIGNNSAFNGVAISSATHVKIGNNVFIGYNSIITDYDAHPLDPESRLKHIGHGLTNPVIIEDNVWIGANAIILKGVKIGKNSVISSNSVVLTNIPSNVIASGNPCKVLMPLQLFVKKK